MASFQNALAFVNGNEGGFQNDPNDSGNYDDAGNLLGTYRGITAKVARANGWEGAMEDLPDSLVDSIYRDQYWTPLMDSLVSDAVAAKILDYRVNFGQGGGTMIAQQAANEFQGVDIAVDGGLGPETVAAINSIDPTAYMGALIDVASNHYRAIALENPEKAGFLQGWLRRVVRVPLDHPAASGVFLFALIGGAFLLMRGK